MLGFSWERLQSRCFRPSVPNSIVAEATPTTAIGGARLFVGATSVAVLGCSWERLQSRSFCSSVPKSIVAEATPATAVRGAAERCLPVGSKTSGFPTWDVQSAHIQARWVDGCFQYGDQSLSARRFITLAQRTIQRVGTHLSGHLSYAGARGDFSWLAMRLRDGSIINVTVRVARLPPALLGLDAGSLARTDRAGRTRRFVHAGSADQGRVGTCGQQSGQCPARRVGEWIPRSRNSDRWRSTRHCSIPCTQSKTSRAC